MRLGADARVHWPITKNMPAAFDELRGSRPSDAQLDGAPQLDAQLPDAEPGDGASGLDAQSLDAAMAIEDRQQVILSATEDHKEALAAFLGKRPPAYRER